MPYSVRILPLHQGDLPPSETVEGPFETLREAWDAGSAEVLAHQLRSTEAAFEVLDADGRIVEVTAEQLDG